MAYNPRWPHTFRILRNVLDENGLPVTDENGEPTVEAVELEKLVYYGDSFDPVFRADGTRKTVRVTEMPWGPRTATGGIKDSGQVFQTDFKISCPMAGPKLEKGDIIELTDYTGVIRGIVNKFTAFNWGTNIWYQRMGNDGVSETE